MKINSFSLTELMVVIAIVAILFAVAIPVYKDYKIGSKLSELNSYAAMLINKSITFASTNGRYANLAEIGHLSPTQPGDGPFYYTNPGSDLAPGDSMQGSPDFWMGFYDDEDQACGKRGTLIYLLNPAYFGFDSDVTYLEVAWYFGHVNGATKIHCVYGYGTNDVSFLGDVFPGCVNENTTSGWDLNNTNTLNDALNLEVSCQ